MTLTWKPMVDRVRDSGRFVALAGSLDVEAIGRLAPLAPDIFAVRGSACAGGDRLGPIDSERVSILARAARHAEFEAVGRERVVEQVIHLPCEVWQPSRVLDALSARP